MTSPTLTRGIGKGRVGQEIVPWGFSGGLVSRWGQATGTRLYTELLCTFMPVAALQSDHFVTEEGRDYDYGVTFGGRAEARAVFRDRAWVRFQTNYLWLPVLSGFNGDHHQASTSERHVADPHLARCRRSHGSNLLHT